MLRYANYKGNAEHILGDEVWAPFLRKGGLETQTVRWVATDAGYNADTDTTRVEFYGEVR